MENVDKKECSDCGKSGCCCYMGRMHGCHNRGYHLVRVILKIVIVILIFWCGFKLGQMSGFIQAEYGHGTMRGADNFGMMRGDYYGDYSNSAPDVTPSVPATPAK